MREFVHSASKTGGNTKYMWVSDFVWVKSGGKNTVIYAGEKRENGDRIGSMS